MVKKTFLKECFRAIRGSLSRFLAIFAIVALGSGFLAGLTATTPDMRHSVSRYYQETRLFDLRVASNLGLCAEDIRFLAALPGVESVMPAHSLDREVLLDSGDILTARIHGVDSGDWGTEADDYLNRLTLQSGRWPEKDGECVVEQENGFHKDELSLGGTLRLTPGEEGAETQFSPTDYTIVGTVTSGYYLSTVQRGATSVGNGKLGCIIYVNDSCFDLDYITDAYLIVRGSDQVEAFSQAYDQLVTAAAQTVKDGAGEQKFVRAQTLKESAQQKLDEAKQKLADKAAEGQQKLDDALAELESGEADYQSGLKQLKSGQAQLRDGENQLRDSEAQLQSAQTKLLEGEQSYQSGLAAYKQAQADAQQQLDDAQSQLDAGQKKLDEAKQTIAENEKTLSEGKQQLDDASDKLDHESSKLSDAAGKLEEGQATLDQARGALEKQKQQLDAAFAAGQLPESAYQAALAQVTAGLAQLDGQQTVLNQSRTELESGQSQLNAARETLLEKNKEWRAGRAALDAAKTEYEASRQTLDSSRAALEQARAESEAKLAEGARTLADSRKELDSGWTDYRAGAQQLSEGKAKLATSRSQLSASRRTLEDARKTLDSGWADYHSGSDELENGLSDGRQQIVSAQDDIDAIAAPEWYVLDRSECNPGYIFYDSDVQKVAAIAKIFPIFFFLVAALVASTTMTRMVDEDRGSIGTLKALGYGNAAIAAKYLLYAVTACLCGSAAGLAIGLRLFPSVINNAYRLMYNLPPLQAADHGIYGLVAAGIILAAILTATAGALRGTLRDCSAALMRPKAPPAGKRILLERIKPVWNRMKFTHKVTARNLFRYKKRFFMTLVGIAGCTALLLTGFGLRDSISDIVALQYGELVDYHLTIDFKHEGDQTDDRRIAQVLNNGDWVEEWLSVHMESDTGAANGKETALYVICPAQDDRLADFITFRDRKTHAPVNFTPDGAILTEKAAKKLGVTAGDRITLRDQDGKEMQVPISGVCENYIYGYLYLPSELYEQGFGTTCEYRTVLAKTIDPDDSTRDAISNALLESGNVTSAGFSTTVMNTFADMLHSIDFIVIVLIISAAALAFVVLYNLTNINICERQKELATIKVLGFYPGEVSAYVYRETVILSLIGAAVGLAAGVVLHQFVVQTAEVDAVMFGRTIKTLSFLYSAAMTLCFTLLVNLVMGFKLRKIDMVESLKEP